MARRTAWVLNLDADLELAAPRYSPTNAVRAAMAPHVARLAASLLAPDDVLVDDASEPGVARGFVGRAFCPTSRAVAALVRAGAEPEPHPPHAVLRHVNGRAFCASLGETLPGGEFVRELDRAVALLARTSEIARSWRVKRAFGMAGRGQRVIDPGPIRGADVSFLRAGMSEGGVQIEPNVVIERELAIHGLLTADGGLRVGRLVVQECDARGQWLATTAADDVDAGASEAMTTEVRRVAAALHASGYFGPFGIDAFLYRDLEGRVRLQPRSEINARYSMGFAVGFFNDDRGMQLRSLERV
jgi:hypothetical protein